MFQLSGLASMATDADSSILTVARVMILVYFSTYFNKSVLFDCSSVVYLWVDCFIQAHKDPVFVPLFSITAFPLLGLFLYVSRKSLFFNST